MMVGTRPSRRLSTGYPTPSTTPSGGPGCRPHQVRQGRPCASPSPTTLDVRRSLMTQKAYAEGLRAVCTCTPPHQDAVSRQIVSGADADLGAPRQRPAAPDREGCRSERAYAALSHESLQTFGGSGFLQDYLIEQYIRDAKIDSLYEGNHRHPGAGLLLPQDRPRQAARPSPTSPARSSSSSTPNR